MKGYNSTTQFVQDYRLYMAAKKIDPGREGETITSYLKKRVKRRLSSASARFKAMLKKRGYSTDDLRIIATHDYLKDIPSLEFFIKECFALNYAGPAHYKKLLSSNAFRSGRLKRLYEFVPPKIETKTEFVRFIRARKGIPKSELTAVMNQLCRKNWRNWLNELIDKGRIQEQGNRWFA